jgi:hypothetical protein
MQMYRYFVTQSSEFCRHNTLCCSSMSVCFCLFRYRLSPETFGYTLVFKSIVLAFASKEWIQMRNPSVTTFCSPDGIQMGYLSNTSQHIGRLQLLERLVGRLHNLLAYCSRRGNVQMIKCIMMRKDLLDSQLFVFVSRFCPGIWLKRTGKPTSNFRNDLGYSPIFKSFLSEYGSWAQ